MYNRLSYCSSFAGYGWYGGGYDRKFIETLGPIALNYFFATSAYFFFSSEHCFVFKMKKRIKTLCLPFVVWNTLWLEQIRKLLQHLVKFFILCEHFLFTEQDEYARQSADDLFSGDETLYPGAGCSRYVKF